jgi:hypothetical protein
MGGSDDPSNLVELTVVDHALAHKQLFEEHGKKQDRLAWLALSGYLSKEEIIEAKSKLPKSDQMRSKLSKSKIGSTIPTNIRKKISETLKSKGIKPPTFTGHNSSSKEAIAKANLGMKHITNEVINKRWPANTPLPDGFHYGLKKRIS